jgi:chemotaxis protein histidine kinase CheA
MSEQVRQGSEETAGVFCEPGFATQLREDLPAEDVRYVLLAFSTDLSRLSETIRDLARAGHGAALRRAAHALAGAAGAVGAENLSVICRAVMTDQTAGAARLAVHAAAIETAAAAAATALARVMRDLSAGLTA